MERNKGAIGDALLGIHQQKGEWKTAAPCFSVSVYGGLSECWNFCRSRAGRRFGAHDAVPCICHGSADECNHLFSLINDVLDMSRIESGTIRIEEKPVSLR